jgi:hypothetical protein
MTIRTALVLVLNRPTQLADGEGATATGPVTVEVQNPAATGASIRVGGPDVTMLGATQGVEVTSGGAPFIIDLAPGDDLWGISAAGVRVVVLRTRAANTGTLV